MTRFLTTCIAVLWATGIYAQDDYIITGNPDTIRGTFTKLMLPFDRYLRIHTTEGEIEIRKSDVHEYRKSERTFMFARITGPRGKQWLARCEVIMEGPMRLLENVQHDMSDYYAYHNGKYYLLTRYDLSEEVWKILAACPAFEQKYARYQAEMENKKVILLSKQLQAWREMIDHFNRECH